MGWQPTLPVPATKIKEGPGIFLGNFEAIENWTEIEHYNFTNTLSGKHKPGECAIIAIVASAEREALTDVPCAIAYDTEWSSFFYNDGAAWNNIGGAIDTGTRMIFYQDTSPIGWTILDELYDKVLYITKGSGAGGETGGTPCSSGTWGINSLLLSAHILTEDEMTPHTHTYTQYWFNGALVEHSWDEYPLNIYTDLVYTGYTGEGSAHSHTVTNDGGWRPATYSCIICEKD